MRYDYQCQKCNTTWELSLPIEDREKPLSEPCPNCKESGSILKLFVPLPVSYQGIKTPLQRAGSGWNDTLNKIKAASGRNNTIETL